MLAGISLLMLACTITRVLRVSDAVCTSANPDTECPLDSVQHIQPAGSAEPMYLPLRRSRRSYKYAVPIAMSM
jgi:hypothetical protein